MPINKEKIFPFNTEQLKEFRKELNKAGNFDALMEQKQAIGREFGQPFITRYSDIEEYKTKHLTGIYEPLRPFYDTDIPYSFWSEMYEMLLKNEN